MSLPSGAVLFVVINALTTVRANSGLIPNLEAPVGPSFDNGNNQLVYLECGPNDTLHGEKLQSILGYAMSAMGVGAGKREDQEYPLLESYWGSMPSLLGGTKKSNEELNFDRYCEGLGKKLGPYEPYSRSIHLKSTCVHDIREQITSLMPKQQPEFTKIISQVTDHLTTTFSVPITAIKELVYNTNSKKLTLAQFVVFKVFRAGENIEISPCLFKVKSDRKQTSMAFGSFSWASIDVQMIYEERKYILNKFMIKKIIQKLVEDESEF